MAFGDLDKTKPQNKLPKLAGPWNDAAQLRESAGSKSKTLYMSTAAALFVCQPCQRGEHEACSHHGYGRRFMNPAQSAWEFPECLCEAQGHPAGNTCNAQVRSEGFGESRRCCRLANGDPIESSTYTGHRVGGRPWERITVLVPACKMHSNGQKRSAANAAARYMESRQRSEEYARERQAEEAAEALLPDVIAALRLLDVAHADKLVRTNRKGGIVLAIDAAQAFIHAAELADAFKNS